MLRQSLHLVPLRRDHYQAKLLFVLFIASLTMFFLAGIITYLIIRRQSFMPIHQPYVALRLPPIFWASTVLLVGTSVFLERACWFVRREQTFPFHRNLMYSAIFGLLFVFCQSLGMIDLFREHFSATDGSTKIFGMSFTLAFVHALHVLGGIFFIGYIMIQARRQKYDHERHWTVNHCAGYWHFLDIVWVAMLLAFVVAG